MRKELGITQQYLLCALNKNGKLSAWSVEQQICFIAGALLELLKEGCCEEENRKITAKRVPEEDIDYLHPLYVYLQDKPRKINAIASDYTFTFTAKRIKELLDSVGTSLVREGCAGEESSGVFVESRHFYPKPDYVDKVIQQLRAELLEEGTMSEEMIVLAALLDTGGLLKKYFSKYEADQLKKRIKEVRKSEEGAMIKSMMDYVESMIIAVSIAGSAAK